MNLPRPGAARLALVGLLALTACAGEPRMGGSSLPPSLDAGPVVVAIPPVPATADASADSADDAVGSVAMARQTLESVCVDDGFVDVQDVALSPDGAALQMCLGTGGYPARNECFALSLAEGVYREIPRTARRAAAGPVPCPARLRRRPRCMLHA